jgi:hypothetical protein
MNVGRAGFLAAQTEDNESAQMFFSWLLFLAAKEKLGSRYHHEYGNVPHLGG